ncbi:TnsD family Tn7-like transposition protein [Massilia terrae]|uniref:TnsD family transposase n=1 Tax=Massilia terrae TaxID=1811224 RepID=A0ABT2D1W6_9BURK|nr:TnsD family Tn7-like transposition protein [Massilia terrae]MCS0659766.1 TnsD family transposase [Massilia terrae]
MLPFFPAAYDDESLYSLMARYHRLSGNPDDRQSLGDLVATHTHVITSHLPSSISMLASSLPPGTKTAEQLIVEHTLFPYFASFLSLQGKAAVMAAMLGDNSGGLKMRIGLVASRIGCHNTYRYCGACLHEESEREQAYWHRAHQLPGVWLCPRHALPLWEVDPSFVALKRHRLLLPDSDAVQHNSKLIVIAATQVRDLVALARLNADALRFANLDDAPTPWNRTYRNLSQKIDLIRSNGRIDVQELERYLASRAALLPHAGEFRFLHHGDVLQWVLRLMRKPRPRATHPFKHMLLLYWLGGCWKDLVTHDFHRSVADTADLPLQAPHDKADRLDTATLRSLIVDNGYTLSRCASELGLSTTTVRVEAARLELPVKAKPKKLTRALVDKIEESLRAGDPVASVAVKHNVSIASAYRILRMRAEMASARSSDAKEREKSLRRARFLNDSETTATRKCADYSWLRRNDRKWLDAHLATKRDRHGSVTERVNWANRDEVYALAVQACAERLRLLDGKPIWVSRAAIGRLLKSAKVFERYAESLPKTHDALAKHAESFEQWQQRRLQWAKRALALEHVPLVRWRILRQAGIRQLAKAVQLEDEH